MNALWASADRYVRAAHVRCRHTGAQNAGTLLLLHGLGGDTTQFDPFQPHLEQLPYDLIVPDMRAHGRTLETGGPHEFTFRQFSADVMALLRIHSVRRPLIGVGISMGAGVLAAVSLQEPGLFAGHVFIRPAWEDRASPANLQAFETIASLLAAHDIATAAAEFEKSPIFQAIRDESEDAAASLMGQFTAPHATHRRLRLARMPKSTPVTDMTDLRRLQRPVAVIGTPQDPIHPLSIAESWASSCGIAPHVVPPKSAGDDRYITQSAAIISSLADWARATTAP
ncbi:alpha/beta fold hydrolase [Streptomyces sp. NPDC059679]|uniref:alpha/beta fold hydrolase n=1 Tax=Streptomyces sp. NPDC059679 TaxID=3346903 RepID=UPI0036B84461